MHEIRTEGRAEFVYVVLHWLVFRHRKLCILKKTIITVMFLESEKTVLEESFRQTQSTD